MTSSDVDGWPAREARLGTVPQVHALGQVTLIYNYLEEQIGLWFEFFMPTGTSFSSRLFHNLGNRDRIDLLSAIVKNHASNPEWREEILFLLRCYDICTANRNILMHAVLHGATTDMMEMLKAASNDSARLIKFQIPLSDLRLVADQIGQAFLFAVELYDWHKEFGDQALTAQSPSLPTRPPKPRQLTPMRDL